MKRRHLIGLWVIILAWGWACHLGPDSARQPQTLILVSVDGFRWDYPEKANTPNLDALMARGVRARALIPCFPTKTFPNHYTIVTGLYPEHHGIIANNILDPELGRFRLSNREAVRDPRWWGGEPIWVTAEKQDVITAACFWPGSETAIKGVLPTYWYAYDGSLPNEARIQQLLDWLDLPEPKRPRLLTTYFSFVDDAGHEGGPDSEAVRRAIAEVDRLIGLLLDALRRRGRLEAVNLIVLSDHGMAAIDTSRVIFLDDYIDLEAVEVVDWNPVAAIHPVKADADTIYRKLAGAHPHMRVYRKAEIPARWHYRAHPRIPAIVAVADEGWSIVRRETFARRPEYAMGGNHGFDNALPSMGAFFVAAGPAFKQGVVVEPFSNIHLYNLFAHLLRVTPAPNDGDFAVVQPLLRRAERVQPTNAMSR